MTIQSLPMVTVKQAAAALGVDKEALEDRLESGRLKGKKEKILAKDVWFIYKSELDALMSKRDQRLFGEGLGQTDFSPNFDPNWLPAGTVLTATTIVPPATSLLEHEDNNDLPLTEQFRLSIKLMSEEFSRCMQASLVHIQDLRDQLTATESKLMLLPDLEVRAIEDRQLIEDKDAALTAAHTRIATLQADVERLSRPWWKKMLG
jgi:hypothetical protein